MRNCSKGDEKDSTVATKCVYEGKTKNSLPKQKVGFYFTLQVKSYRTRNRGKGIGKNPQAQVRLSWLFILQAQGLLA